MADPSQGTGSQSQQGTGDEPKYVTEEQLNRAITARLSEFSSKFKKDIGETISKSIDGIAPNLDKLLDEKLQALKPATDGKGKEPDPKAIDIENHPTVKGLLKRLDESEKRTKSIEGERDTERARARDVDLRKRLSDLLAAKGIPADRLTHVVGYLVDAQKRVRWNDDFSDVVFREKDGDVDLETGASGWLKGDEAKIYLPPRGTSGSGDRGGGKRPAGQQQGHQRGALGQALVEAYAPGVTVLTQPGGEHR